MLKRKLCEAVFEWELSCDGPLLIADGRYQAPKNDKNGNNNTNQEKGIYPDKLFISRAPTVPQLTPQNYKNPAAFNLPYYIPGTSLRGPFRAQAERIIRTLATTDTKPTVTACNPFDMDDNNPQSCSKRLDKTKAEFPYSAVCPACKLFGCTATASRIEFTDAEIIDKDDPNRPVRSVYRDMIGIDRFTGGVYSGANMRFHALENTRFSTTITVTNFELWQLGLLAYVLRDFEDGLVPIGFGKTKGFGQVKGTVKSIELRYPKTASLDQTLAHLGSLASSEEQKRYQLHNAPDCIFSDLIPSTAPLLSIYSGYQVTSDKHNTFWEGTADAFNHFMHWIETTEAQAKPEATP